MKIAMMVRGFLTTPVPQGVAYSPATVALKVAEGLTRLGHEVTFYGPEGTNVNVTKIETCNIRPALTNQKEFEELTDTTDLFSSYLPSLYDAKMARQMLENAKNGMHDCVIFNHFESVLSLAPLFPTVPVVYILHDYIDDTRRQMIEMHHSDNQHFISISNSQRNDAPDLNYAATVYNGVDIEHFAYEDKAEDYLMFSGRITQIKGVKEAVQAAVQSNQRLLIAGNLSKVDYWYFDEHIKPYLNDRILYLGMLDQEQLVKYYQKAKALLMPIQWQEPFGLSMAEANACGTPIIAFNRGSVPEVIEHGKTGFIVDNSAEMIMSISKIDSINRRDCRRRVSENFTSELMVENYENVLSKLCAPKTQKQIGAFSSANDEVKNRFKKLSKRFQRLDLPNRK